jgi:hypothetical protein
LKAIRARKNSKLEEIRGIYYDGLRRRPKEMFTLHSFENDRNTIFEEK